MNFDLKRLYELLPALYRIRDTELGIKMLTLEEKQALKNFAGSPDDFVHGPLKALLSIIADQVAVLEENLEQLYADQFIETCAEWVVPYIGQLVGTRGLIPIPDAPFSQRGAVANTISYRRRKGTAAVIEQLARDVTGWNTNVVEYFQRLATTQYLNHLRPENLAISGIRNWELLEYFNTPFDRMAHTADVRRIEPQRGKYNIPNIGIFLWRLGSYTLEQSPAYKVDERRYTFDALGKSRPIYNHPEPETEITHLAEPINVPIPLGRRVLANYMETYYGDNKSVWIEAFDSAGNLINTGSQRISVCNLSDVFDNDGNPTGWAHPPQDKIAIDPVLGRIAFPVSEHPPARVQVSFYYAFGAEIGGGGYERESTFTNDEAPNLKVSARLNNIQNALNLLVTSGGVVEIQDNEYYYEDIVIKVAQGKTIELRSADKVRPVLVSNVGIRIEAEENASVLINGLLMSGGSIHLPLHDSLGQPNKLKLLRISHCTLLPGPSPMIGGITAQQAQPRLVVNVPDIVVEIEKSITGAMQIYDGARVNINNSIVDAANRAEMAYAGLSDHEAGGPLYAQNSTFIGRVHTMLLEMASNCIFMAPAADVVDSPIPVRADRLQQGCVRFSYLPPGSRIPRPYRCQPTRMAEAIRVQPMFTSLHYGDPGYCQLSTHCATEIKQGADDESEMGAFHLLYQPQRVANLKTRLEEYLRFGLEAGVFFAS